ncbi:unnamed protein product [Meloidogyne enterolobii]
MKMCLRVIYIVKIFFHFLKANQDNLTTNHTTFNVFHFLGARETIQNYQNKFKEKQQQLLSTNQKPSLILFYEIKNIPQNNILKNPTEPEPTTNLLNDFNKG